MDQSEAALSIVEELWKKSFEFSRDSKDPLISLLTKTFETITVYLGQSIDYEYMQTQIASLDNERQLALQSETNNDVLRRLSLGLIEAVQIIMSRDTKKIQEMIEKGHIPIPNFPINFSLLELKEEEIDEVQSISAENQMTALCELSDNIEFKEEDVMNDDMPDPVDNFDLVKDNSFNEPFEDPDRTIQSEINGEEHDEMQEDIIDNDGEKEEIVATEKVDEMEDRRLMEDEPIEKLGEEERIDIPKNSSENIKVEQMKTSSRKVIKHNYNEDSEASVKKSRLDFEEKNELCDKINKTDISKSKPMPKKNRICKRNDTELECPECEFRTWSVKSWVKHLDKSHSTTPSRAGFILRCECGHESFSDDHSRICKISKITVVRKGDGTTKEPRKPGVTRVNHTELECPECEFRTMTVFSWIYHLKKSHSTNPTRAGLILRCECGNASQSDKHIRVCKISKITIVRNGNGTIKEPRNLGKINHTELECPECAFRTMSATSWVRHLHESHSTNPTKAGLILRCECGNETFTDYHSRKCNISKITVVRKENGTTKRAQAS